MKPKIIITSSIELTPEQEQAVLKCAEDHRRELLQALDDYEDQEEPGDN